MTKLTDHEMEVLSRLAQGYNQREVAKQMHKTPQEINCAVGYIRKKHRSLDRAIEWYMDQHKEVFEADELPEPDEPQGPVQRCDRCNLVLPHDRCLVGADHIYRQHDGSPEKSNKYGPNVHWSQWNGEESVLEAKVYGSVGRGKK